MIEIGDYVRTKTQGIKRIDTIFENRPVNKYGYEIGSEWDGKLYSTIKTTDIIKHSKNIIDLIEAGDFVNGFYIDELSQNPEHKLIWHLSRYGDDDEVFKEEDIKSIVTKEQFESVTFKV